jgi:hypothetical protein
MRRGNAAVGWTIREGLSLRLFLLEACQTEHLKCSTQIYSKANVVNLCPREYGELVNAHTSINPCLLLSYPTHSGHNEIAKLVEALLLLYSIVIEVQTLALVPTIFVDCLFGRSPYEQTSAHVGQHGQVHNAHVGLRVDVQKVWCVVKTLAQARRRMARKLKVAMSTSYLYRRLEIAGR